MNITNENKINFEMSQKKWNIETLKTIALWYELIINQGFNEANINFEMSQKMMKYRNNEKNWIFYDMYVLIINQGVIGIILDKTQADPWKTVG